MAEKRKDDKGRNLPDGFSQRSDGRYQARFTFEGKRYTLYDMQLGELKRKVTKKKYELTNGICEKNNYKNLTLNQWYDKWTELYRINGKFKYLTLQTQSATYDYYVRNFIGDMRIDDIKQVHIMELFKKLQEKGLSFSTISKVSCVISSMYRDAILNELVEKNPAIGAIKSLDRTSHKVKRALTLDEQNRFLDFVRNDYQCYQRHYNFFVVAFNTGMRVGELCGLTWDDIDFENKIIHVNKTMVCREDRLGDKHQKILLNAPKTPRSKREIPMLPIVVEALQKQLDIMKHREVDEISGYNNFVFCSFREKHVLKPATVLATIRCIVKRINIKEAEAALVEGREPEYFERFTPHEIRHTFTTRCFECGMNPKIISELLGHTTLQMTMNVYTHVSESMKFKEIELLNKKDEH